MMGRRALVSLSVSVPLLHIFTLLPLFLKRRKILTSFVKFTFSVKSFFPEEYDIWGAPPQNRNLFIKKLCIYSNIFKLQSPSKYSPFDVTHLLKRFPTVQVLNVSMLRPFSASTSLFHFFHVGKTFPFEDFFHPGKQNKSRLGQDWVNREGRARGSCHFLSKTSQHSGRCGRSTHKPPTMKLANTLKESSGEEKIHWSQTQPLTETPAGALMQMGS